MFVSWCKNYYILQSSNSFITLVYIHRSNDADYVKSMRAWQVRCRWEKSGSPQIRRLKLGICWTLEGHCYFMMESFQIRRLLDDPIDDLILNNIYSILLLLLPFVSGPCRPSRVSILRICKALLAWPLRGMLFWSGLSTSGGTLTWTNIDYPASRVWETVLRLDSDMYRYMYQI